MTDQITINNSDGHDPPLQFMVVNRFGLFVDLSKVQGQLFDPTVLEITWGYRFMDGRTFGTVKNKNGTGRNFADPELMEPYLRAWKIAKGNHELSEALKEQQRKDDGGPNSKAVGGYAANGFAFVPHTCCPHVGPSDQSEAGALQPLNSRSPTKQICSHAATFFTATQCKIANSQM